MQKRQCPNGHIYDPSIYGDQCPLCPQGESRKPTTGPDLATHLGGAPSQGIAGDTHTHVAGPSTMASSAQASINGMYEGSGDASGATKFRPSEATPGAGGGHTVIRRPGAQGQKPTTGGGRRLVGFLVTYNRHPEGKAYNIYEGRNYVGRDSSCDICVEDDSQMSGRHMSILYRSVDDKFKFRDEQSSNGTFINSQLLDDGELSNYDIVRAGSTIFIFIAIPNIN